MLIGYAASNREDFARYMQGTFLTATSAATLSAAGTMFALLLLGHDLFWLVVAFHGIIKGFYYREHEYSLIWWSTIFPLGKPIRPIPR